MRRDVLCLAVLTTCVVLLVWHGRSTGEAGAAGVRGREGHGRLSGRRHIPVGLLVGHSMIARVVGVKRQVLEGRPDATAVAGLYFASEDDVDVCCLLSCSDK